MKTILVSAVLACLVLATHAVADNHGNDDADKVWAVVEASWVDDAGETGKWPGDYLHAEAFAWSADFPSPRDAASVAKWSRFTEKDSETLMYELFPMQVTVVGDTAVAHYAVVTVSTDSAGKRQREMTGIVETLARVDGNWTYVGLASFDMGND